MRRGHFMQETYAYSQSSIELRLFLLKYVQTANSKKTFQAPDRPPLLT